MKSKIAVLVLIIIGVFSDKTNAQEILNGQPIYFLGGPPDPNYLIQSGAWNDGMIYKHYTSHQFFNGNTLRLKVAGDGINAYADLYLNGKTFYFLGGPSDPNYLIQSGVWNDGMKYKHFTSHQFYTRGMERVRIDQDGNMKIGSVSTPAGYRLYVQTGILTEKVKVAVAGSANWADYVFNKDYKLMALAEVEQFIKANNHLPNVPSAAEMVKEGNDLGKTDAKLLEKIEELTLYMIEMKKINDLQQKENEQLKKILIAQDKRIELLENKLK